MLLLVIIIAAGATVPNFEIAKICETATATVRAVSACVLHERAAKERLVKAWPTYSAEAKATCAGSFQLGIGASYVEMEACFEMQDWKAHLQGPQPQLH
jgi:hypothetical protein